MSIEAVLAAARTRIRRADPAETALALRNGAIVIDLRCREGGKPATCLRSSKDRHLLARFDG